MAFFTAVAVLLVFLIPNPVTIMSLSGIISTIYSPVLVGMILYINKRYLPQQVGPNWLSTSLLALAGLFYAAFAIYYLLSLVGVHF